jgi:hypothetical protein
MNSIKSRLSEDTYKRCGKQEHGIQKQFHRISLN